MMAEIKGQCRHCLRFQIIKRGICLKCRSSVDSMEDLMLRLHDLQAKLKQQKYLNRLLEFQLRRAKIRLERLQ